MYHFHSSHMCSIPLLCYWWHHNFLILSLSVCLSRYQYHAITHSTLSTLWLLFCLWHRYLVSSSSPTSTYLSPPLSLYVFLYSFCHLTTQSCRSCHFTFKIYFIFQVRINSICHKKHFISCFLDYSLAFVSLVVTRVSLLKVCLVNNLAL